MLQHQEPLLFSVSSLLFSILLPSPHHISAVPISSLLLSSLPLFSFLPLLSFLLLSSQSHVLLITPSQRFEVAMVAVEQSPLSPCGLHFNNFFFSLSLSPFPPLSLLFHLTLFSADMFSPSVCMCSVKRIERANERERAGIRKERTSEREGD